MRRIEGRDRILAALPTRNRLLVPAFAALSLAVALLQRPGLASSDTKIHLHVDPGGFLGDVASAWSSTGDLGHVQGGQYGGYLFPMGPFFALGHWLGAAPWLVQRLWLALLLFLAAWGAIRLMDELVGRGQALTGLLMLANPYTVVFSSRTTITLLGYAALPWLLLCVHRGLAAERRRWWWPAAFALIVTASGGGVNAAVTAWVLVGPALLAAYQWWAGLVGWRQIAAFGWRAAAATAAASAWWVMPLLVQSRYGVDFLRFTEQPGTIWSTTSLPESLRLMGYWISYLGVGYGGELRPYLGGGGVLLFALPVVLAGLLIPALSLLSFAWTRRHPYAPFALALVLAGLLVMVAGFPEGTPLRRALNFTYNNVAAVQFLRTTYKAGPLVALGIALLAGLASRRALFTAAIVALTIVACWPLTRGRALDSQLLWDRVPAAWTDAAEHVDATAGDGRAVVLPGQLYAHYSWGGTIDPILPVLADKPVAVRNAVGYADLRAVDMLWTVDALVQQRRALPGQLDPLLDLLGARTVVAGADDDRTRSGAAPAAEAADVLDQLGEPDARWGREAPHARAAGTLGEPRTLPEVRAWDRPQAPGLVRVEPAQPQLVVDGSAEGVAALAALDGLDGGGLAYAADLEPAAIRAAREVVITDSNRRRILVPSRLAQNAGPTAAADEELSVDAAVLDPFGRGSDAQTVAVYDGIARVSAPSSPGFPQFPERRPFAALDGDPATHWQADRYLMEDRRRLDIAFDAPRDIDAVELLPYNDRRATVTAVEVNGRRFDVRPGWNT
jgi:arabinofuranan 3-O-arabinosyltransferase